MATKKNLGKKEFLKIRKNFEKIWEKTPKFQEHKIKYENL